MHFFCLFRFSSLLLLFDCQFTSVRLLFQRLLFVYILLHFLLKHVPYGTIATVHIVRSNGSRVPRLKLERRNTFRKAKSITKWKKAEYFTFNLSVFVFEIKWLTYLRNHQHLNREATRACLNIFENTALEMLTKNYNLLIQECTCSLNLNYSFFNIITCLHLGYVHPMKHLTPFTISYMDPGQIPGGGAGHPGVRLHGYSSRNIQNINLC